MKIQLHDNWSHLKFAPLTLTRPVGNLRVGIMTNDQRWSLLIPEAEISYSTEEYLSDLFSDVTGEVVVNACVIPNEGVRDAVIALKGNEKLSVDGTWIASKGTGEIMVSYQGEVPIILKERWDLYQKNGDILEQDYALLTKGRTSVQLSSTNTVIGDASKIFLEQGAKVEAAILNSSTGPIYIGKDAEIMEGSIVRGPFAMCEKSALKIGAKVYGPTTLGPFCKAGGELNNVVFQEYSNKGHDGFLGNSLIGAWCNLGADTNTSNLKNNYGKVKTWSYESKCQEQTDIQFMGLVMGDHSKCGINTMFNTATVVGVCCNVFGSEFPPKYIPDFTWGKGDASYDFDKAVESINNMMSRRERSLNDAEIAVLKHIADKK